MVLEQEDSGAATIDHEAPNRTLSRDNITLADADIAFGYDEPGNLVRPKRTGSSACMWRGGTGG